jgi:hypothetical protein
MTTLTWTDPTTATLVAFLQSIGLDVRAGALDQPTFLPGIKIDHGGLVVDETQLRHPGDLLHEAGHLAVATPERRAAMHEDAGGDPAEEMMALAWSYAAIVHLQLDPAIVFHDHGYRGDGASLIENFEAGRVIGLPMLQWVGLTLDERNASEQGLPPFPHMLRWLRER